MAPVVLSSTGKAISISRLIPPTAVLPTFLCHELLGPDYHCVPSFEGPCRHCIYKMIMATIAKSRVYCVGPCQSDMVIVTGGMVVAWWCGTHTLLWYGQVQLV
jgi:hypothetical protein